HADREACEVRRRPVRVLLEAVMLGRPVGVEAGGVGGDPDLDIATDAERLRHVPRSRADGGALEDSELERHGRGVYPARRGAGPRHAPFRRFPLPLRRLPAPWPRPGAPLTEAALTCTRSRRLTVRPGESPRTA